MPQLQSPNLHYMNILLRLIRIIALGYTKNVDTVLGPSDSRDIIITPQVLYLLTVAIVLHKSVTNVILLYAYQICYNDSGLPLVNIETLSAVLWEMNGRMNLQKMGKIPGAVGRKRQQNIYQLM